MTQDQKIEKHLAMVIELVLGEECANYNRRYGIVVGFKHAIRLKFIDYYDLPLQRYAKIEQAATKAKKPAHHTTLMHSKCVSRYAQKHNDDHYRIVNKIFNETITAL